MAQDAYAIWHFHVADYIVFAAMILLSTVVGIWFAYLKPKKEEEESTRVSKHEGRRRQNFGSLRMNEYLVGSQNLKIFPVAMSLVASYVSGVTVLGTPSEIYYHGTQYSLITVAIAIMGVAVSFVYLPVFIRLNVQSSYEYLEMRFGKIPRSFASILFIMDEIFFLPFVVYVPAICFNQVSGVNIYLVGAVIVIVCVIYTLVGGIKAVVHTDAWQILVMFLSVFVVLIIGAAYSSGHVFQSASDGGRLIFFNMNPSMYERQSFWGVIIGGFFYWTSFNAVNQTMVQRYMSLSNLRNAQVAVGVFVIGIVLFLLAVCFCGLLIYDYYQKCDPLTAGLILRTDQLFPVYVMQTIGHLHGIPGLFVAGVFGAALSSLSVVLNSTALVFFEDIIKGIFKKKLGEKASFVLIKSCILVLGVISLVLILVLERLSGILSVGIAVTAIAAGTTFGMFTLGMLIPWANTKGTLIGAIVGSLLSGWIALGTQIITLSSNVYQPQLPVSTSACMASNGTEDTRDMLYTETGEGVFPLYRLSFHWINPIGVITTVLVGTIASFLTGPTQLNQLDADLITPLLHRFLPKEAFDIASANAEIKPGQKPLL